MLFVFAIGLVICQLALPKHLGFIPMFIAAFHVGDMSVVSEFTSMRLVVIVGLVRAYTGGFFKWTWSHPIDRAVTIFAIIALLSSLGHEGNEYVSSPLIERIGLILNVGGSYLYARAYFAEAESAISIAAWMAVIIIPFSGWVAMEKATGINYMGKIGLARLEVAGKRNGGFRARGSFGHSIIAGTMAATTMPFMVLLYMREKKQLALFGGAAALIGTFSSASSGPMAALVVGIGLLYFWRWREYLGGVKIGLIGLLIFLHFAMSKPIWFLIARIDIVGGSTGYHRSLLIDAAMNHLDEWWLAGTDFTRHWIFSGVTWNPYHTDITNYYLQMGVLGGLPLIFAFLLIIYRGLGSLVRKMEDIRFEEEEREELDEESSREFELWCVWVAILMHCVSFISIAYFDQSYAMFFCLFGWVATLCFSEKEADEQEDDASESIYGNAIQ